MIRKLRKTPTEWTASIIGGELYFEDVRQCSMDDEIFPEILGDGHTNAIRLISLSDFWYQEVYVTNSNKVREDINFQLTLRREVRSNVGYWYAYRRVFGKLYKHYVGRDEEVTEKRLLSVCQKMPTT